MSRVNLYTVFHLNLAFSSIPEASLPNVVAQCYRPLLEMVDKLHVKVGIEATGWTLEKVEAIDPRWIKKLRQLIKRGDCEFVGSGYAQIIGPLVPAAVTQKNLEFGDEVYERLLQVKPEIAYINEQTYSQGLVRLYKEAGYSTIVTEWNNAYRYHPNWRKSWQYYPQYAIDQNGRKISVLWNNTTTFQKFQSYVHGELDLDRYTGFLETHAGKADRYLPLYGSDIEVFDFRADRYANEIALEEKVEWKRIATLFKTLKRHPSFNFVLPSEVLRTKSRDAFNELQLASPEQPIVVKKQEKYNVTRWALTGVNDLEINSTCFRIFNALQEIESDSDLAEYAASYQKEKGIVFWKELCFLWDSDFRTHIERKKFEAFEIRLQELTEHLDTIRSKKKNHATRARGERSYAAPRVVEDAKSILLETDDLKIRLLKDKGLAIDELIFKNVSKRPVIGTLAKGYYDDISLEEDFYCGQTQILIPGHKEVTDLKKVAVSLRDANLASSDSVKIDAVTQIDFGTLKKTITIYKEGSRIDISYDFKLKDLPPSSFRTGAMTFNPEAFDQKSLYYRAVNGGKEPETFHLGGSTAIAAGPVSLLVSARSALGNTTGILEIGDKDVSIVMQTDMAQLATLPMVNFAPLESTYFLRTFFSLGELDDTSFVLREKDLIVDRRFTLSISARRHEKKKMQKKPSDLVLYETSEGPISYADIEQAIRKVGIKKGDTILVHSDISAFGKIALTDRDMFFGSFVQILQEAVGDNGTLIMPTFTYSMTEGKIFDVHNSPSTVGALTEYFRKLPNVTRTVEPILSVAIWGKHRKDLSIVGTESFGKRSIFDMFHALNGTILLLGSRSCTFFHHIECMYKVPYRFDKKFKGKIRNGGKTYPAQFTYFARRLSTKSVSHFSLAAADMLKSGSLKKVKLGHSAIAAVGSDALFKEVVGKLNSDPEYYLRSDLSEAEEKKLT